MKNKKTLLPLSLAFVAVAATGVFMATPVTANAESEFEMEGGAAIRIRTNEEENKYGIRFSANVGTAVEGAKYNVMIIPVEYVEAYEAVQGEKKELAAFMLDAKAANEEMPLAIASDLTPDKDGYIAGSIVDILWDNLSTQFVGAAYYEYNGEIVCAELAQDGTRSVVEVASNAIKSGVYAANETVTNVLTGFVYNAVQQKLGVSFEEKDQAGKEAAITLTESEKEVTVGDTFTLSYTPYVASNLITWESSDTSVATVTNGEVEIVGAGQATITADLLGLKATCVINASAFVVPEGAITYTGVNTLDVGRSGDGYTSSLNLKTATTVNGEYDLVFGSDNESVATVDPTTGVVTPVANGTANLYATVKGTKVPLTALTVRNWTAISTPEQFMALNSATSGYYYLTNNLDMTGYVWKGVAEFTGIIDGNYHAVSNLSRQPGSWSGNASGTAAFITNLTNGSTIKNIAFVDYMVFALWDGDGVSPLGFSMNSGFVQTNNGTMENLVVMITRNKNYSAGWEQQGFGNGNGTVLAFTNNGTIKNCVGYNVTGGMTYALVGRNTGIVDNVYGFWEKEDDDPNTPNVVNQWSDWRGVYDLSVVWKAPLDSTDHHYGFHDISQLFGCDNIENPPATNSALINGFNDVALGNGDFNEQFEALVNGCFNSFSVENESLYVGVGDTIDLAETLALTLVAQSNVSIQYAVADNTYATITSGELTGVADGETTINVQVVYNGVVYKTIAVELNVTSLSAVYTGGTELHVNRPTEQGGIVSLDLSNSFTLSDGSAITDYTVSYESSNEAVVVINEAGVATVANGATSGSADLFVIVDGMKLPLTTVNVISWTAISTPAEFAALGPVITEAMGWRIDQVGNYYLTADLDMSQVENYEWSHWTTFTGILDGNNHVVSNLKNPGVTYQDGMNGASAFIGELTEGSIVRNIGFVNYTMAYGSKQAGFVVTNNGTIENVLFMATRDTNGALGWLTQGMGLICSSALTWTNNGTIKNCVVYHHSGSYENYAIVAANNQGTIDNAYGFVKSVESGAEEVVNTWTGWRGTYNIGIVWQEPNAGFADISSNIGVTSSNAATNSAALTGFDDPILVAALEGFDKEFAEMVRTYYKA